MKKAKAKSMIGTVAGVLVFATFTVFAGMLDTEANAKNRIESARYYTANNGTIVTETGIERNYAEEFLYDASEDRNGEIIFFNIKHDAKDNVPVYVLISDKGTPENTGDDEIIKVGLDWNGYMEEIIASNNAFIEELKAKCDK